MMTEDHILAPNLYLCTYQIYEEQTDAQAHPLWQHCDHFLDRLASIQLTADLDFSDSASERPIFLRDEKKEIPFQLTNHPEIEGFVQPCKVQDSYGLWVNIGYPDPTETTQEVPIQILQQFNPDNILRLPKTKDFSGETFLLTVWLTPAQQQHSDLTELANQCYQNLFNSHQSSPPLSRRGELFGSPLFEYGNQNDHPRHPQDSPHVLIWLFRDKIADISLQKCFYLVFELFFYRHKVTRAFQDRGEIYQQLKRYYRSLDSILDKIQNQLDQANPEPFNDTDLKELKTQLKNLSKDALQYDRLLRKMKDLLTTVNINSHNYNGRIEGIAALLDIAPEKLSFWQEFGQETAGYFRGQIEADLSYFEQGSGLITQAITSIRAIVEVDQSQCERNFLRQLQKEEQDFHTQLEKNREQAEENSQKLEDKIQAVGVGIAAGAIVASTSGLITQPWQVPNRDRFWLFPHPFVIALVASLICAVGGWYVAKIFIEKGRSNQNLKK